MFDVDSPILIEYPTDVAYTFEPLIDTMRSQTMYLLPSLRYFLRRKVAACRDKECDSFALANTSYTS